VTTTYTAALVPQPDEGVRLAPAAGVAVPEDPSQVNLLALAVVHALGVAGWEHHPQPRNPEVQTLEAVLTGEVSLPWRAGSDGSGGSIECTRQDSSVWTCRVAE
jgi:hypothetical protein